ncbi:MAG: beta strand repeat-containing protein [Tenuifilaceae bacterium]
MRKLYSLIIALLIAGSVYAQAPEKISYQAVIRNSSNQLVTTHAVGMKISILQGTATGSAVYTETITPTPSTNANGLVSIEFGGGAGFNTIDWANGPYFIKTETDPTGGSNYTITGTSQFLTVPYALHAKTADNGFSGDYSDLSNKPALFDGQYNSIIGAPTLSLVATSGSYTDLSNKPTLFSGSFTDLTNKPTTLVGYGITDAFNGTWASLTGKPNLFDGQYSSLSGTPALSLVATSGSYNDLANKPTLFSGSFTDLTNKPTTLVGYGITDAFNGTWASLSGKPTLFDGQYSSLTGAPSLSTVATSGSYNDLSNKPTLFSGSFTDLTNKPTTLVGYGITDAFNGTWASLAGKPTLFDGQYSSLTGAPTLSAIATTGSYNDLTNKPTTIAGYGITDAMNTSHAANGITGTNITNWNTAYGWGNHALAGYLTSYTETDPNSWKKTGNAGTTAGTNFIGTTDNNDLTFKVNNINSGIISTSGNTSFGYATLSSNTIGSENAAFGLNSMSANTSGVRNAAFGLYSLDQNTTGFQNTAFGTYSLYSNTTGFNNTIIGYAADVSSGDLSNAIAIGYGARVDASGKVQIGNSFVDYVALGTSTNVTLETGLVKITGGTPGVGKVLTSDATGLASWSNLPAAADGSETKVTAGTNVTITGSGTTASPYLVNSTQAPGTETGQMQYWNGTAWVIVAAGTNGQVLKYKNGVPTWVDENINVLSIGDSYRGGIIAYFLVSGDPGYDANVRHGIIAAPSDQSTGTQWGCFGTTISGADGIVIGTGNQNTIDIMADCATAGIAARLCGDLSLGGYSDWYLPSQDELNKLYLNRVAIGGFANNDYLSSTESNINGAWGLNFLDGTQASFDKSNSSFLVRAVRSF